MIKQSFIISAAVILLHLTDLESKPVDNQLYQRDKESGKCSVPYETSIAGAQLRVSADGVLEQTVTDLAGGSLTAVVDAGLVDYKFELMNGTDAVETVDKVACGDAYLIYGQSNAEAGYGSDNYAYRNDFIRTYRGSWSSATPHGSSIGYWGMHLGRVILEKYSVPVCIINGAKGNTSIAHLLPDADYDPVDQQAWITETSEWGGNFYKRMQAWAEEAGLTNNIRALLWHQGERNVYDDTYDPAEYYEEFIGLKTSLNQDYPGVEKIFLYQVRPGCGGYGDMGWSIVMEEQRRLAVEQADIEAMSTLSFDVAGCHYGEEGMTGYEIVAEDLFPLLDTAFYGGTYPHAPGAPMVLQVAWTSGDKNEIVIEFDQTITWNESLEYEAGNPTHEFNQSVNKPWPRFLKDTFSFDEVHQASDKVVSGRAEGRFVYLELSESSSFSKMAYPTPNLDGIWPGPYITGTGNGTGALGFWVDIKDELDTTIVANVQTSTGPGKTGMFIESQWSVQVRIDFSGPHKVQMTDIRGNIIRTRQGRGKTDYTFSKYPLPAGVYLMRVSGKGRQTVHRFAIY